ncbi:MAG: GDP-mannose 4,6-dehydratase [Candidatus Micrarchaeota archaeon]|nr:GDP-mannose 4,6-dehydratase [Candidatus Micrarchaeota archaeon]
MYLITGGAGFIGSNLADALDPKQTIVIDDLSNGKLENISHLIKKGLIFRKKDIAGINSSDVKDVDVIFHEAALVSVPLSFSNFDKTYRDNVSSFVRILEMARKGDIERVVFASSAAVYETSSMPVSEDDAVFPKSPYAESKLIDELYARIYYERYGMKIIPLRYFNVYGPRQNPSSPYSGVISIFASRMMEGKEITIYGNGKQVRDFVYVKDVVNANILSLKLGSNFADPINVASGKPNSILELFSIMKEKAKYKKEPVFKEKRQGDVDCSLANISKAKELLDFHPKYLLEDGLEETIYSLKA